MSQLPVLPVPLPIQPEELEVLKPRKRLTVATWAESRRKLSKKTTDLDGDWSHDYTPYLVEIMESLSDVGTRQVTVRKCSQSGGTEAGLNFIGWIADESPAPAIIVMPREDDAKRRVNTRIRPMFESSPTLRRHLPGGRPENLNVGKETVLDNMIMYLAWAGSPAALADNPVCYVILDEVGKFPAASGREADPVSLIKKRQRTFYWRSKLYVPSTPVREGDLLDREYHRGDQRQWWVKCPACGQRHVMGWAHVHLDKTERGELLEPGDYEAGGRARYVCPHCRQSWNEQQRWLAVSSGRWAPAGCSVNAEGRIVGKLANTTHRSYHITAFMLHPRFQSIDQLASEWTAAQRDLKNGDVGPLQDFINSQLAENWTEAQKQPDKEKLRRHIGTYEPGLVPPGVQMLTVGIDVQLDHIWVGLDGWGYLSEAWSLYEARLETGDTSNIANYQLLREFLAMTWPLVEDTGQYMIVRKAAIDCQYNTDTVIDFCRQCSEVDIIPVRGDDSVRNRVYRASKVAGGTMIRYDVNVNVVKDRLYRLLHAESPGPGYFHLHRETSEEVLQHLTAEEQRRLRQGRKVDIRWAKKQSHLPNHLWDVKVYSAFAAELAGVRMIRNPESPLPGRQRRVGVRSNYRR